MGYSLFLCNAPISFLTKVIPILFTCTCILISITIISMQFSMNENSKPMKLDFILDCIIKISLFDYNMLRITYINVFGHLFKKKNQNNAKRCSVKCQTIKKGPKKVYIRKILWNIFCHFYINWFDHSFVFIFIIFHLCVFIKFLNI